MTEKKYKKNIWMIAFVACMLVCVFAVALPAFAAVEGDVQGSSAKFPNPFGNDNPATKSLYGFVYFVLTNIVLPIGSVVVVFFIIYAGYLFVTARGSEDKLDDAKHTFYAVVIGALILLGSWTIATAIKGTLCQIADGNIPDLCTGSDFVGPPSF